MSMHHVIAILEAARPGAARDGENRAAPERQSLVS